MELIVIICIGCRLAKGDDISSSLALGKGERFWPSFPGSRSFCACRCFEFALILKTACQFEGVTGHAVEVWTYFSATSVCQRPLGSHCEAQDTFYCICEILLESDQFLSSSFLKSEISGEGDSKWQSACFLLTVNAFPNGSH